jgi:hypothetical protein
MAIKKKKKSVSKTVKKTVRQPVKRKTVKKKIVRKNPVKPLSNNFTIEITHGKQVGYFCGVNKGNPCFDDEKSKAWTTADIKALKLLEQIIKDKYPTLKTRVVGIGDPSRVKKK